LILLLNVAAQGGELANGFRGIPFGDPAVLQRPPFESCKAYPYPDTRWVCTTQPVPGVTVDVAYILQQGRFVGVLIKGTMNALDAAIWRDTLNQHWGAPMNVGREGDFESASWLDGNVIGTYKRDVTSGVTTVTVGEVLKP
jgi:hypothetical protein